MHQHKCDNCGNAWSHSHASFNNRAEHTCRVCGAMQWRKDHSHAYGPANMAGLMALLAMFDRLNQ